MLCLSAQLIAVNANQTGESTPGLVFTQIEGQNAYEVSGGTAWNVEHIIIPSTNPNTTTGWPVTRIASGGFDDFFMVSITIPNKLYHYL